MALSSAGRPTQPRRHTTGQTGDCRSAAIYYHLARCASPRPASGAVFPPRGSPRPPVPIASLCWDCAAGSRLRSRPIPAPTPASRSWKLCVPPRAESTARPRSGPRTRQPRVPSCAARTRSTGHGQRAARLTAPARAAPRRGEAERPSQAGFDSAHADFARYIMRRGRAAPERRRH